MKNSGPPSSSSTTSAAAPSTAARDHPKPSGFVRPTGHHEPKGSFSQSCSDSTPGCDPTTSSKVSALHSLSGSHSQTASNACDSPGWADSAGSLPIPTSHSPPTRPRALDLFSGTGSVGTRLCELGYEVTSLDIDRCRHPDILVNIFDWDYRSKYPQGHFSVIAAGVPCNEYSPAKTVGHRRLDYANRLVEKFLEIIKYFDPPFLWMENPRMGLLKEREVVRGIPFIDVDSCQFEN